MRTAAFEYKVVKNTLSKRAVEGTSIEVAKDLFLGPIGLAIGYDDPVLLAKRVLEYCKSNEKLKIKGGFIEGDVFGPKELKVISELPPREVQLSMLASAMQSPLYKLGNALHATLSRFLNALEALKEKK